MSYGYREPTENWLKAQFPTELEMTSTESFGEDVEVTYRAVYTQRDRVLRESVEVNGLTKKAGERLEGVSVEEYLASKGVSREVARERVDRLVRELVLPDFLAANPSIRFTTDDWGLVKVVYEGMLR
jgi:RNase H-fold protein (predicted Holliday junction resolvase)